MKEYQKSATLLGGGTNNIDISSLTKAFDSTTSYWETNAVGTVIFYFNELPRYYKFSKTSNNSIITSWKILNSNMQLSTQKIKPYKNNDYFGDYNNNDVVDIYDLNTVLYGWNSAYSTTDEVMLFKIGIQIFQ